MEKKKILMEYATTFSEITDMNPNFAMGKMRIGYIGDNRKMSNISKEVFEAAIPTMFNCPVVARYDREHNRFGSHDMELVVNENEMKLVNVTHPLGVVPSGASYCFEDVTEEDGTVHTYLTTDVLLWKRQEGYAHLLELETCSQSMEVDFLSYHVADGICVADKICFSAFCLLESAEPCFEGAQLKLFGEAYAEEYSKQYSLMMEDMKELYQAMEGNDNTKNQDAPMKEEFASLRQKVDAAVKALRTLNEEMGSTGFYYQDMDDTYIYCDNEYDLGRFPYVYTGNAVEIVGAFELVSQIWLSEDELTLYEEMKANYADLVKYKEEKTMAERLEEVNSILNGFADIQEEEAFQTLKDSAMYYSLEELQTQCFAIRGRTVPVEPKVTTKQTTVPLAFGMDENPKPYGGLFELYGNQETQS